MQQDGLFNNLLSSVLDLGRLTLVRLRRCEHLSTIRLTFVVGNTGGGGLLGVIAGSLCVREQSRGEQALRRLVAVRRLFANKS